MLAPTARVPVGDVPSTQSRVFGPNAPLVNLDSVNPGPTLDYDNCLTIRLAEEGMARCGDLFVTHPLPPTWVRGKQYQPTLIYNSATARLFPLVNVRVTRPVASGLVLDSMRITLEMGGIDTDQPYLALGSWPANEVRHTAIGLQAPVNWGTQAFDYKIRAVLAYRPAGGGAVQKDSTVVPGVYLTVNQSSSPLGAGWNLAGWERVFFQSPEPGTSPAVRRLLRVGGDGGAALYRETGTGTNRWVAYRRMDFPDTIVFDGATPGFRNLRGGARVAYSASGCIASVTDAQGAITTYNHSACSVAARLSSIVLPNNQSYNWSYHVSGLWVSQIAAPPIGPVARNVIVNPAASGRLTSITDPDARVTIFDYGYGAFPNFLSRKTDKRGTVMEYGYDVARKASSGAIYMGAAGGLNGPVIATAVTHAQSVTFGALALAANIGTVVDGPRTDVTDVWQYFLNRDGAPKLIVDPLGKPTSVFRQNLTFHALVTRVVDRVGFTRRMGYNNRGNLLEDTAANFLGDGREAITKYQYPAVDGCDKPTQVLDAESRPTTFSIDPATCNTTSIRDGRGLASGASFTYYTTGIARNLVETETRPGHSQVERLTYDAAGNLFHIQSGKGFYQHVLRDAIGRDTLSTTPFDSTDRSASILITSRRRQRKIFDVMNRVLEEHTAGPARVNVAANFPPGSTGSPDQFSTPAESARVVHTYDEEGNRRTTARSGVPLASGIGALVTSWDYDRAHRVERETAPDLQFESYGYDNAGNRTSWLTRQSEQLFYMYDALNRLKQRTTPAAFRAPTPVVGDPSYPYFSPSGLTFAVEVDDYAYDDEGRQTQANNSCARITRTYRPGGAMATERQQIRTRTTSPNFTQHDFTIQYQHDLTERRIGLTLPPGIAPIVGNQPATQMQYAYYPTSGLLQSYTDVLGATAQFTWDGRNRPSAITDGPVQESFSFDEDDRLLRRTETVSGVVRHDDNYFLDAAGRPIALRTTQEDLVMGYSAVGTLALMNRRTVPQALQTSRETYATDALGHQTQRSSVGNYGASPTNTASTSTYTASGRLVTSNVTVGPGPNTTNYLYDARGNQLSQGSVNLSNNEVTNAFSYYDALGQLRVVDKRYCKPATVGGCSINFGAALGPAYEEYGYDAVGRRVWMRSRREPVCNVNTNDCFSHVTRFVWDGSQLLFEIRYPGGSTELPDSMERDTSSLRTVLRPYPPNCVFNCQPNPDPGDTIPSLAQHYGRILYQHAGGIDRPRRMIRIGFQSNINAYVEVRPLANWRGLFDGSENNLQRVDWPAARSEAFLFDPNGNLPVVSWFGGLKDEMKDASGLQYRRNRYYDPGSGRFTQEDPIGLAGGLNLYGYANGDPVNLSDPFGLCPMCVAYAIFEVGSSLYDAYDLAKTSVGFLRGRVSGAELSVTAAGAALGVVSVGGGIGRAGREVAGRLIRDATDNPSNWKTVGAFTEAATNKAARGGTSIQTILENQAGDRLVRHTVVDKSGKVIDDHFRPMYKPRVDDIPKE